MISLILFILNVIFLLFIFIVKARKSVSDAFLNVGLIIIIFSIGWAISTSLTKLIFPSEGFGENFTADDIALLILTIGEFFFYRIYYKDLFTEDDKEK